MHALHSLLVHSLLAGRNVSSIQALRMRDKLIPLQFKKLLCGAWLVMVEVEAVSVKILDGELS